MFSHSTSYIEYSIMNRSEDIKREFQSHDQQQSLCKGLHLVFEERLLPWLLFPKRLDLPPYHAEWYGWFVLLLYSVLPVSCAWIYIQCGAVIAQSISSQIFTKTPHSSPVVDPASDWYSASVLVNIYAIYYSIIPCFNGTRIYTVSLPYQA